MEHETEPGRSRLLPLKPDTVTSDGQSSSLVAALLKLNQILVMASPIDAAPLPRRTPLPFLLATGRSVTVYGK